MEHVIKSPRLIMRGDVVKVRGTDRDEVVREVVVVLRLGNGASDSYTVDERVVMGDDGDIEIAPIVEAVVADANKRKERAEAALQATRDARAAEEAARAAEAELVAEQAEANG